MAIPHFCKSPKKNLSLFFKVTSGLYVEFTGSYFEKLNPEVTLRNNHDTSKRHVSFVAVVAVLWEGWKSLRTFSTLSTASFMLFFSCCVSG
jgi:hypothetical protein